MKLETITKLVMVIVGIGLIAYDVIPFLNPKRGDTISEVLLYYSLRSVTIPFACGVLSGHFFFPRDGGTQYPKFLFSLAFVLILADCMAHWFGVSWFLRLQETPGAPFLIGIPVGAFMWTQSKSDKLEEKGEDS